MTPSSEELLKAILALPVAERLEFVETLLTSLDREDRPAFDESWREVIRRRSTELQAAKVTPVPWSEVKRQAREAAADY